MDARQSAWDVATVVVEFDFADDKQSVVVADEIFAVDDVLTVRIGGRAERSVYRVDVPRGAAEARSLGAAPAIEAAARIGVDVKFVRISITSDGLGDPEGEPPAADALPWRGASAQRTKRPIDQGATWHR